MSKFCGKCSSKLNENGLYPNCDFTQIAAKNKLNKQAVEMQKRRKRRLDIEQKSINSNMNEKQSINKIRNKIMVLLIAMLTIFAAFCGCTSSSAEDVAQKAAQAYVDGDASAYYDLLAPGYVDYVVGDDGWYETADEFKEDAVQDSIDELRDKFVDRCGENYSAEVSVVSVEPCQDVSTLEKVQKELIRDYNYEEGDIEDVTEVEVRFRCTGNDTGGDLYKTYYCVKENGSWYIHRPDIDVLS